MDLDALLDMSTDELVKLFTARARRRYSVLMSHFYFPIHIFSIKWVLIYYYYFMLLVRFQRGLKRKPMALIKKLRKAVIIS